MIDLVCIRSFCCTMILVSFKDCIYLTNKKNSNLQNVNVYVGADGKLHFVDSGGADSVLPFNSISNYKITHAWDNLSQLNGGALKNGFTITFDLPICKNALLIIAARQNESDYDWEYTINSGNATLALIAQHGATMKTNFGTTMAVYLVSSISGSNMTFKFGIDNDYWSVKIAALLEG